MSERQETRSLPCTLTDAEVLERSAELAEVVTDYAEIEGEKSAHAKHFKERLDGLRSRERALAREISSRSVERDVECVIRQDPIRGCVETMRLDTGELIEDRPMTAEERQLAMDLPIPYLETEKAKRRRKAAEPEGGEAA
jgi:hypothetical protein